jgi:dolichol kinase
VKSEVVAELRRKSIHVIPGFLAYPVVMWLGRLAGVLISALFLLLYLLNELSLRKGLRVKVPIAYHTYRVMAREEELKGRYFTGTIYFWLLTLVTILLLEPQRAVAAVMVSSLGDAAAAITGKAIGGARWPFNKRKTLAGSLAMLAVSISSCLLVGIQLPASLAVPLIATIVEASTRPSVLDELTVPLAALIVLLLIP